MSNARPSKREGFTLIELMVAVAIIALLIGILVPTFKGVTQRAKVVATQGRFSALSQGLESFRGERALGSVFVPSGSDDPNDPSRIADPFQAGNIMTLSTGANLLVYGLAGADRLGTPGFRDWNGDGRWFDDQHASPTTTPPGSYAINQATTEPLVARYPGGGGAYVDDATQASIRTLQELFDDGVSLIDPFQLGADVADKPLFTDAWDRPILYYRANRAGRVMVTDPGTNVGVYDQRDNALITGTNLSVGGGAQAGIDFGPGLVTQRTPRKFSKIGFTDAPSIDPNTSPILAPAFNETFERFIYDQSVTAQNRPVNPDTYLLISAGEDAIYGTADDVVNWERR